MATTPKPPRTPKKTKCKTCPTLYVAGTNGGSGHCSRCLQLRRRGKAPGARVYQPRGKAKVGMWTSVLPDLYALITKDALQRFSVPGERELLELALATLLERPDLVTAHVRATQSGAKR